MKKIKIEKTGLCIFLLALPLILILILSVVLAATIPVFANAGQEWMIISTVIAVAAIIFIFVYLYRLGPALMSLILIARIKKSADYDDESIHTTTLYDFIKLTRKPLSEDEKSNGENSSDHPDENASLTDGDKGDGSDDESNDGDSDDGDSDNNEDGQ